MAIGVGSTLVFILLCLVTFNWWFNRQREQARVEPRVPEPEDTLTPEAEAFHNAPSGANPAARLTTVKTKKVKKKAKAAKPRRPPKTRKTRFDRIGEEDD